MFAKIRRSLRLIPLKLEVVIIQAISLLPCYPPGTRGGESISAGRVVGVYL